MIKYLVYPYAVTSKFDGCRHYIGASKLMHLYGVIPSECLVIDSEEAEVMSGKITNECISLSPRYHGDYKE